MSNGAPVDADARAEAAFRAAFEREAAAAMERQPGSPAGFDPRAIRRRARERSLLKVAGAAAAVLLVCGGVVMAVQFTRESGAPAVPATDSPAKGWRFEYYRDVRLQVPDSWRYDDEPRGDWCVARPGIIPKQPYVAREESFDVKFALDCGVLVPPPSTWVDHVTLSTDEGPSRVVRTGDFWVAKQRVGDVKIKVVTTDWELAERILASAETVEPGDSSCDPHSDIQARGFQRPPSAFDVATLDDVDAIRVCQYTLDGPVDTPGLMAQYELVGDAALAELKALQSAPLGDGPDRPENCIRGEFGESAIVLELVHGDSMDEMYLYYSSCRGNGFDDGTAIRTVTKSACRALIQPPITLSGGWAAFARCVSD